MKHIHLHFLYSDSEFHEFLLSGVILKRSNRVLTIQRVKKEDSGLYICTACNQQGCDSHEARITVDGECVNKSHCLIYFILLVCSFKERAEGPKHFFCEVVH